MWSPTVASPAPTDGHKNCRAASMLSSRRTRGFAFAALDRRGARGSCCARRRRNRAPAPDATVVAIWQIERIEFAYSSTSVRYSCGNLQRRIAAILQAVGAHSRIGVELGCTSGELVRYANVHLTLAVPVEASEENVRAATDFGTRDELVARLHQSQLPTRQRHRALSGELAHGRADTQSAAVARTRRLRPAARHARRGFPSPARTRRIERPALRRRRRHAHHTQNPRQRADARRELRAANCVVVS